MAKPKSTVSFYDLMSTPLKERRKLKAFILSLFDREEKRVDTISYIFCSDEYLLKINQDYLKHDDLTDIITFDLSESTGLIKGEVYISIERVKENAQAFQIKAEQELLRVIFHGALHLCGYADKSRADKATMTKKEDEYLELYARYVPRGTILKLIGRR